MLSFVPGFQKFPEIEINLHSSPTGKTYLEKETGEKTFIFSNNDDINGDIYVKLKENLSFDHAGIQIELIGIINSKNEEYKSEFLNMSKELESPGEFSKSMTYNFSFKKVSLPYESYEGTIVFVRYLIRVTIIKRIFSTKNITEKSLKVNNPNSCPLLNANVRMEVGIANLIHFEYELYQSKFYLEECVIGKIYFIRNEMKVKAVEIHLVKRETIGTGTNQTLDSTLISKFEVIDGNPAAREIVPIRMFINSYELSPTYKDINNTVSVKYFIKFVVIDDDDKSFFKQQEIILWRKNINSS